ncbi:TetR/AcrR family transcriptional repressor of nem operon [Dyadobacter sp. BE34]|uniref:TetR/AcrR family transcriptional repressor of nem operon n=1 Tax=Dyadobacter fermentans TaxID=94254 RepID=A0ABU1QU53_9BACT|nr:MULTISPECIES: TetR/AcrR family transcriptional regulator [Dyadobacter]MDR6804687.1 TetR/AcrR family transcriptional repressor of nem operon [Dyadobacter fermentans]MDR7043554.1 TetR/AcrR family transcriptional repressor of nem operon [Dyadobacter sp. BE242]MDR7197866.1 TetR/AcrR family transcriptional repressor of nem operon [Dyadobacter sp. BE34]MDR7214701.1 TetR/AcrR family transcriptional repressor of nem operon [Dyadobacter sp. BE31]MDR7262236.1 TetR/AcrR family transcriptional represso
MARNRNFDEQEILDRAIDLFKVRGYRGTTPEELVNTLGISRSSLYNTFGDKHSLLLKTLHRYYEKTVTALEHIIADTEDPLAGIKLIFKLSIEGTYPGGMPEGCFLINSIIEFGPDEPAAVEIVKKSIDATRAALLHFVACGKKTGKFSDSLDTETMADYLQNCINGIVVSAKAGMSQANCERMVESTLILLH